MHYRLYNLDDSYICVSFKSSLSTRTFSSKKSVVAFFKMIFAAFVRKLSRDPKVKFYWCIMFQKIFATFALTDLMACTIVVLSCTMLTIFFGPPLYNDLCKMPSHNALELVARKLSHPQNVLHRMYINGPIFGTFPSNNNWLSINHTF